MISLDDVDKEDYSGFTFKLSDDVAVAGQAKATAKAAVRDGKINKLPGNLYAASSLDIIADLFDAAQLEYIEPDFNLKLVGDFDEQGGTAENPTPDYPTNDTYREQGKLWNLDMLNVGGAWELGLDGDPYVYNGKKLHEGDVKVAVIDTGLYGTGANEDKHEDLDYGKVSGGKNFVSDEAGTPDAKGHGTFVSGIIAARAGNATGVAGCMPGVTIVPEKVFDTSNAKTSDVVSAVYQAVDVDKVDVINMSLGGAYNERTLQTACDYAVSKDVLVVASAGNDGTSTANYPAAYSSVVGVGSVDNTTTRSSFSQYGSSVFVTAPGEGITSTYIGSSDAYRTGDGTSFSGPEVAALGAMCKSIYPDITQDVFKQLLTETSKDLGTKGYDDYYGYGLVDFGAMAQKLKESQVLPWYNVSFDVKAENGTNIDDYSVELKAAEDISWDADASANPPIEAGSLKAGTIISPEHGNVYALHRGAYGYEVTADGKYMASGTFKTYAENQKVSVNMQDAYPVTIGVKDAAGAPMSVSALKVTSAEGRVEKPKAGTGDYALASGRYSFEASADGYENSCGSFTVLQEAKELGIFLYKNAELATVDFNCVFNDKPVSRANVEVYDAQGCLIAPQDDGSYRLAKGVSYKVTASKIGYQLAEKSFIVGADSTQAIEIAMQQSTAAITFAALNSDYEPIENITVSVADSQGQVAEPSADNPLRYYLGMGEYTYRVDAPGYESAEAKINVDTESRTYKPVLVAIPQKVTFNVTDGGGASIEDASVRVSTTKRTTPLASNSDGSYSLAPGAYRYSVFKTGYELKSGNFSVAGNSVTVDVALNAKATAETGYEGGSGTAEDPYLIATEEQLRYLASQTEVVRMNTTGASSNRKDAIGGYYKLVSDIELSGNWLPIGNWENSNNWASFSGTFDGDGHVISGLSIDNADDAQGLFGYVTGAVIRNLTVEGSVKGHDYVGGIVGRAYHDGSGYGKESEARNILIENCASKVRVEGRFGVGGIAGTLTSSLTTTADEEPTDGIVVRSCSSSGALKARLDGEYGKKSQNAGGIAGTVQAASIEHCYSSSVIDAGYTAGGIGGTLSRAAISNCYSSGVVRIYQTGSGYGDTSGAIAGKSSTSVIRDCYGSKGIGNTADTLVGSGATGSIIESSTLVDEPSMYRSPAFVTQMNTQHKGGDVIVGTEFVLGNDYPMLTWQVSAEAPLAQTPRIKTQPEGNSQNSPYKEGTKAEPIVAVADKLKDLGTLTWQWYVASDPDLTDAAKVEGASGAGMRAEVTPSTQKPGIKYYYAVFTNRLVEGALENSASKDTQVAPIYTRSTADAKAPVISKLNPTQNKDIVISFDVKVGSDLELSVTAASDDGGALSYQWYSSKTPSGVGTAIKGATGCTYTPATSSIGTSYYYVKVINTLDVGNEKSTSSEWITVKVSEYSISTYEELAAFRSAVNSGVDFTGITVTLTDNITIPDGVDWEPIGTKDNPFTGNFMGGQGYDAANGTVVVHTISNLHVDGDAHDNQYLGLFGMVSNANIYDLQVQGTITGETNRYAGLLVGYAATPSSSKALIANCSALAGSSVEGKYGIGGLVGYNNCTLSSCANHANVTGVAFKPTSDDSSIDRYPGAKAVGGVVGRQYEGIIANCYNDGKVTVGEVTLPQKTATHAGGVAGYVGSSIESSYNAGELFVGTTTTSQNGAGVRYAGAVAGYVIDGYASNLHYADGNYAAGTSSSSAVDYAECHSAPFMRTQFFTKMMNANSDKGQFVKSVYGAPRLAWEADTTSDPGVVETAEPYITNVESADEPRLTSKWKLSYYAQEQAAPIVVTAYSADDGALTYRWQQRSLGAGDDAWVDIPGANGGISAVGDDANTCSWTPDTSIEGNSEYRCVVTNTNSAATQGSKSVELDIPAIVVEVRGNDALPKLKDPAQPNSADNPWLISNAEQLSTLSDVVNGKKTLKAVSDRTFKGQFIELAGDVDLSGIANWSPIGAGDYDPFCGVFNGKNHKITGLCIQRSGDDADYLGLFGYAYGATLRNFEVMGKVDAQGSSAWSVAGVVGATYGSFIENVVNGVDVTGYDSIGGIVANAGSTRILDCENLGNIGLNDAAKADSWHGYDIGGICGTSYNKAAAQGAGIFNCVNHGNVAGKDNDGRVRVGAVLGTRTSKDVELSNNYYREGCVTAAGIERTLTGIGANAVDPEPDASGVCEALADMNSPMTSWKLNTDNGAAINNGRWGNFKRNDFGGAAEAVHLVEGDGAKAIYRVDVSDVAANITVSAEYACKGQSVDVNWTSKDGFNVSKIGYKSAGSDAVTWLADRSAQISMPAADVSFVSEYAQDLDKAYELASAVMYKGAAAPDGTATVSFNPAGPCKPGAKIEAAINVASGYQIKSVKAVGAYGTAIALAAKDAASYSFTMPAEGVTLTVELEDEGAGAANVAPSLSVNRDAMHSYNGSAEYRTGNLLYRTIAFSGSYFDKEYPVSTASLQGAGALNVDLYEQNYSVKGKTGLTCYTGADLSKLIKRLGGKQIADETPVMIEASSGATITCTFGDLDATKYSAYDASSQPVTRGLPVLLAYGADGKPFTDGMAHVIFGQKTSADDNSTRELVDVTRVCVGDDVNYSQHVYAPYNDMDKICGGKANTTAGKSEVRIRIYKKDGTLAGTKTYTVAQIEAMANADRAGIQRGNYATKMYTDGDTPYADGDGETLFTDYYEGYDLYKVLKGAGIGYDKDAKVQFYQSGQGTIDNAWKTVDVSLGYLAGNGAQGEGDYSGNFNAVASDASITGLHPMIVYGKNSYPLVWSSGSTGVVSLAYNYRGPLMAMLPQNAAEGGFVKDSTATTCFLGQIDVYLTDDSKFAGATEPSQPGGSGDPGGTGGSGAGGAGGSGTGGAGGNTPTPKPGEPVAAIATAEDFAQFAQSVNDGVDYSGATVVLGSDIDLSGVSDWMPIGTDEHPFNGTFEGNGHRITGLNITSDTNGDVGLFGCSTGRILNVEVSGSIGTISGGNAGDTSLDNIGGIVGHNKGAVSGCTSNVSIVVASENIYAIGGVVGQNEQGASITRCANTGSVTGTKCVGGICGRNCGLVSECYNTAAITGNSMAIGASKHKDSIGGICGQAGDKSGSVASSVRSCYNTGSISNPEGQWYGGICGSADNAASISGCYNIGSIATGFSWEWNPIIGKVDAGFAGASSNYSLEGLNAGSTSEDTFKDATVGTVLSAADLKAAAGKLNASASAYAEDTSSLNGGFPILAWQTGAAPAPVKKGDGKTYQIIYVLDGGVNAASNPDSYVSGAGASVFEPTKEGFKFEGWFLDAGFTRPFARIAEEQIGDITLYAKWLEDKKEDPSKPGESDNPGGSDQPGGKEDAQPISIESAVVSVAKSSYAYTGKSLKPAVTVTFGGIKLKSGVDFMVSYSNNKKVGTAKVVVAGIGKYAGSVTGAFKIVPKTVKVKSVKAGAKSLKVKWGKAKSQTSGYQIRYAAKKNMKGAKTKTVKGIKATGKSIKKLAGGKKYYVQVRAYKVVDDKKYCSAWSSKKNCKTKK